MDKTSRTLVIVYHLLSRTRDLCRNYISRMLPKKLEGRPRSSNVQENKAFISQLLIQITQMKTTVKILLAGQMLGITILLLEN